MCQINSFSEKDKMFLRQKAAVAKAALLGNVRKFEQHPVPLLIAGEAYSGFWLEHNQDNLFLADYHPEAAWASQQIIMDYQREDGLLPFMFRLQPKTKDEISAYWHIQSVYPFTRCAFELAVRLGKGEEVFAKIYKAAACYDEWLVKYRNRKGAGLVEMYCEWDTGHDGSPRVTDGGIPHTCPGFDAKNMPDLPLMPVLSADLSAMLYGGRLALAELAGRLGKSAAENRWREKAAELRHQIYENLYDADDDFYYDRDMAGFRKYRSEHITRLFLNRVLDQKDFDRIYTRYFTCETEFWTAYPFPSMSVSDPSFVPACPKNSWACNTQGLTVLRALLWMEDYGRKKELHELMYRWLRAFVKYDNSFTQEINPFTGAPIGCGSNYSPSLIMFLRSAETLGILSSEKINHI